jgi:hypothetical protein
MKIIIPQESFGAVMSRDGKHAPHAKLSNENRVWVNDG